MSVRLNDVYWKNKFHKEGCYKILKALEMDDSSESYNSLAYLISATGKTEYLLKFFKNDGSVIFDELIESMGVYSNSERSMILFALQLFNSNMSDIKFSDVVYSLDSYNYKCVLQSIEIRYGAYI